MALSQAEISYGVWTNRLLDAWRLQSKRTLQWEWAYVQVTERQKRGHPHSHIITTFRPNDLAVDWKRKKVTVDQETFMAYVSAYTSEYLSKSLFRAGMGREYDITEVRSAEGVSRYVAKYLFKDTIFSTVWPKGWKRVRYSQSFPKQPSIKTDAFVLLEKSDWLRLYKLATIISPDNEYCERECMRNLRGSDIIIH